MKKLNLLMFSQILLMSSALSEPLEKPTDISPLLQPILEESKLPSLSAALIDNGRIKATGAVGVRKLGEQTPVTVADKYHLGSCTKSMTATLTAILVEDGLLAWDDTIADVLKSKMRIHGDFLPMSAAFPPNAHLLFGKTPIETKEGCLPPSSGWNL